MQTTPFLRRLPIILLVLLGLAAMVWWIKRPEPIAVILAEVDRGKVESTIANTRAGTVEACQRTRLSTILGGRIEVLAVKEGDRVKKGQLLLKLWNQDQQAQDRLARAQLDVANKRVGEACVLAANAAREADRQAALRANGFISLSAEEAARAEAGSRRATCETAKATVAQARAQVAVTQVEQGRTVLYAPFSGTVAKIVGEIGEYSTPSPPGVPTPPAIDLIDDSCLYVKAPMDEVDTPKIQPGQPVRITLDALPKQSFPGHVRRIASYVSTVEKQSRTVDIEATFDQPLPPGKLLAGYSADVEVVLGMRENAVRVPTPALLEGSRALVVRSDGTLEERQVKIGLTNWAYTEVLEGLAPGEKVVTSLEREGIKAGALVVAESKTATTEK